MAPDVTPELELRLEEERGVSTTVVRLDRDEDELALRDGEVVADERELDELERDGAE